MRAYLTAIAVWGCARTDPKAAIEAVGAWSAHVSGVTGTACAQTDSDGDGYCSCTVFRGPAEPLQLQCGCERFCFWNCARGCKFVPAFKIQGPQ